MLQPLVGLLTGSLPLGTWRGARVRAHASLPLFVLLTVLLGTGAKHFTWIDGATSMGMLLAVLAIHEMAHCLAARKLGGAADDVLVCPLGELSPVQAPQRPWPSFLTALAGPLANLLICAVTGALLWHMVGHIPWNAFYPMPPETLNHGQPLYYIWWGFSVSYILLLLNLLPILPLDGGQMIQTALWGRYGYYRSMNLACTIGLAASVLLAMAGLVTASLLVIVVAVFGFLQCYQQRVMLREIGPEGLQEAVDFSASLYETEKPTHRRKLSRRAIRRIRRKAMREQQEVARIDAILEKVSARGLSSLTWRERRALRRETCRQREMDVELEQVARLLRGA